MCSSAICFPVQPHTLSEWSMHHGPVVYSFLCCIVLHWTITAYSATVRVYLFSRDMTLFDFLMLNQLCIIGINLSENCGWIPFADILFRIFVSTLADQLDLSFSIPALLLLGSSLHIPHKVTWGVFLLLLSRALV